MAHFDAIVYILFFVLFSLYAYDIVSIPCKFHCSYTINTSIHINTIAVIYITLIYPFCNKFKFLYL